MAACITELIPFWAGGGGGLTRGGSGGSGGRGGGVTSTMSKVGALSTVMPRFCVAAVAVPNFWWSVIFTLAGDTVAGTAMVAVMMTLADSTVMVTAEGSTPAAVAKVCCKSEVSA